jgi:putative NADH-flavin reductase
VVSLALERGYDLTVFVRTPDRFPADSRVKVIAGSIPEDNDALVSAMRGQDAVISALGAGKSFDPHALMARAGPAIVTAMLAAGVRRLIFTSAYGVGPTRSSVPLLPRIFIGVLLRRIYADKETGEAAITGSDLDWTLVHPSTLTNGRRTGKYRVGEHLSLRGFPTISRADVAGFLLSQIDSRTYLRRSVVISA